MITGVIAAVLGIAAGAGGFFAYEKMKKAGVNVKADKVISEAKKEASDIILKATEKAKEDEQSRRKEIKKIESRVEEREKSLDEKLGEIVKRTEKLGKSESEVEALKNEIRDIRTKQQEKLEKVAKLSRDEAKTKLLDMTEKDIKADLLGLVAKLQKDTEAEAEEKAQMILATAMERIASESTAERTVSSVDLPNEEIKGRIIGKEGRNIQAIQRVTGVDIMVDDTPGVIVLSSFDPVRRQVARATLEILMKDGRIHPSSIESAFEKAQKNIDKEIQRAGEDAAREVGVVGLSPELIRLIGELKFRTSYGQNVLKHSTEMAQLAGVIAAEIGADVQITKKAALLHDIGKAVTHRIEGKHHHISAELAQKYGIDERTVHAIAAHHEDIDATTPEAVIIRVTDSLSSARPGARNVSAENFAERMRELENVALAFNGIDKAYAVSAGREIRVMVVPEKVDDLTAVKLARDIANKIEATMSYPGTIKVDVIRETRATEYAK
ncbi:MAG: ribonuclease Y [Candidatus Nomurabacteria bacterium]|jgi:ribonuclease Y|nr:ribonuclease Y [Candidatus Nomurabacteria bacterium]